MHRFFAERIDTDTARLLPQEARHALTVLRLKAGEHVQLILEDQLFDAVLADTAPEVTARLESALPSPEPRVRVTLYQGLPKADKVDLLVQKCTEAGVSAVRVVEMARSVSRLNGGDAAKKTERWQRIAQEAAKQSGRAHVPAVEVVSAKRLPELLGTHELVLVPWEEAHAVSVARAVRACPESLDIAVVIGPEGGMTPEEVAAFQAAGAVPVTMGPRIFRTETAGLAALIMLLYERGEYGAAEVD